MPWDTGAGQDGELRKKDKRQRFREGAVTTSKWCCLQGGRIPESSAEKSIRGQPW